MSARHLIGPAVWISLTVLAMTYGPVVLGRIRGKVPPEEVSRQLIERSPQPIRSILGEQGAEDHVPVSNNSDSIPKSPQQVPEYVREVIEKTTTRVIERSSQEASKTASEVTANLCTQIVTEIKKQCPVSSGEANQ